MCPSTETKALHNCVLKRRAVPHLAYTNMRASGVTKRDGRRRSECSLICASDPSGHQMRQRGHAYGYDGRLGDMHVCTCTYVLCSH
jgi:hypothetical protein